MSDTEDSATISGAFRALPDDIRQLAPLAPLLKKSVDHMKQGNLHQQMSIEEMRLLRSAVVSLTRWQKIITGLLLMGVLVGVSVIWRLENAVAQTAHLGQRMENHFIRSQQQLQTEVSQVKTDVAEETKKAVDEVKRSAEDRPKAELIQDPNYPHRYQIQIPIKATEGKPSSEGKTIKLPVVIPPHLRLSNDEEKK